MPARYKYVNATYIVPRSSTPHPLARKFCQQGSQSLSHSRGGNELTLSKCRSYFYQTPRFITEYIMRQGRSKVPGQPVQWIFQVVYKNNQNFHHVRCQVRQPFSEFDKINITWILQIYIHVMRSRKTGRLSLCKTIPSLINNKKQNPTTNFHYIGCHWPIPCGCYA